MRFCFRRDLSKAGVRAFVRAEMTKGEQTKPPRRHLAAKHDFSLQERGFRSGNALEIDRCHVKSIVHPKTVLQKGTSFPA